MEVKNLHKLRSFSLAPNMDSRELSDMLCAEIG